jgi:hypothetical protein
MEFCQPTVIEVANAAVSSLCGGPKFHAQWSSLHSEVLCFVWNIVCQWLIFCLVWSMHSGVLCFVWNIICQCLMFCLVWSMLYDAWHTRDKQRRLHSWSGEPIRHQTAILIRCLAVGDLPVASSKLGTKNLSSKSENSNICKIIRISRTEGFQNWLQGWGAVLPTVLRDAENLINVRSNFGSQYSRIPRISFSTLNSQQLGKYCLKSGSWRPYYCLHLDCF